MNIRAIDEIHFFATLTSPTASGLLRILPPKNAIETTLRLIDGWSYHDLGARKNVYNPQIVHWWYHFLIGKWASSPEQNMCECVLKSHLEKWRENWKVARKLTTKTTNNQHQRQREESGKNWFSFKWANTKQDLTIEIAETYRILNILCTHTYSMCKWSVQHRRQFHRKWEREREWSFRMSKRFERCQSDDNLSHRINLSKRAQIGARVWNKGRAFSCCTPFRFALNRKRWSNLSMLLKNLLMNFMRTEDTLNNVRKRDRMRSESKCVRHKV